MSDQPEVGVKPNAMEPITTKVTPVAYDHGDACAHGLAWISVDGECWHRQPRTDRARVEVYVLCEPVR